MQIGCEVDAGGEDALAVLAFRFAVELLPPLADEVQLRLVVHHDFNLLTCLVETVAHGGILGSGVLIEGHVAAADLLHILSTLDKLLHVETGAGDGQQTHRREHRETTAHVVGNDERLVALLVGAGAGSTTLGVGDGHDDLACLVLAHLGLALLLQQAEGQGCLGGGSTLRDVDDAETLALQVFCEFKQIVLADVVSGEEDGGILAVLHQPAERVAQCLDDGACTQIGAADASHDHHFALPAQRVGHGLHLVEERGRDASGQMQPTKEVVTRARAVLKRHLCLFHLRLESLHCALLEEARSLRNVKFNVVHDLTY